MPMFTALDVEAAETLLQLRYGLAVPSTSGVRPVLYGYVRPRSLRPAAPARVQVKNASGEWELPSWKSRKPDCRGTGLVSIGKSHAKVPRRLLEQLPLSFYTQATRDLLSAVFTRKEMATHTLTGRPSPAFPGYPVKKRLNPTVIEDVVATVVNLCRVPECIVRNAVTTKCADEAKMFRNRLQKENVPPSSSDSSDDTADDDDEDVSGSESDSD